MTKDEFIEKYNLKFDNKLDELLFISYLDKLYLEFTREQAIAIVADFYDNADNIFNDMKEQIGQRIEELIDELQSVDKKNEA